MPPTPPRVLTIRALYRSLPVDALVALQEAFLLDIEGMPHAPMCQAFCEARMKLIREILKEKAALKAAREAKAAEKQRIVIPEN